MKSGVSWHYSNCFNLLYCFGELCHTYIITITLICPCRRRYETVFCKYIGNLSTLLFENVISPCCPSSSPPPTTPTPHRPPIIPVLHSICSYDPCLNHEEMLYSVHCMCMYISDILLSCINTYQVLETCLMMMHLCSVYIIHSQLAMPQLPGNAYVLNLLIGCHIASAKVCRTLHYQEQIFHRM